MVGLSVHLSVTLWYCIKMMQAKITKSVPMNSPRLQLCQIRFVHKFERVHIKRMRVMRGGQENLWFLLLNWISKTVEVWANGWQQAGERTVLYSVIIAPMM